MRKWWLMAVLLGLVAVAALGLGRTRFETDVLAVLPSSMPEVKGLQQFQEVFSRDEELVVLIEGSEAQAGTLGKRAGELGELLEEKGLVADARWQPRWRDDPRGLAELVAWLWLNGDPDELRRLAEGLSPAEVESTLDESIERIATAIDGSEMMLSAHDPFGFLGHSSMAALFEASDQGGGGFESADGRAHLLLLDAPREMEGYHEANAWLGELRAVAREWAAPLGLTVGLTGDPAFEAEIGTSTEKDMRGTVGVTSALIGVLFLLMQRRLSLLAGLALVLGLIFATAMGLAGWIYGELSIMAAGFAAILIGLAVDYGVLICQEAKVAGHDAAAIRHATARSIGWAAATTAAVFLALNLSGLPGIAQLGTIVAFGVVAGAVLMIAIYVPWVARAGAGRATVGHKGSRVPGRHRAGVLAGLLLVGSVGVLLSRGAPGVAFDRGMLRPRNCEAMETFERIQQAFPEWASPALKLVIGGGTDEQVRGRIAEAKRRLEALRREAPGLVRRVEVPEGWWPTPARVESNRPVVGELAASADRLLAAADAAGFAEEGYALGRAVLEAMPRVLAMPPGMLPADPAAGEILRGFVAKDPAGGRLLGTVEVRRVDELGDDDFARLREVSGEGIHLAGWALLRPAVLPLVKKDVVEVFLPMLGLMVVMLALVFRDLRDVGLALFGLALSGCTLLAAMRLIGIEWNFLNIAATPLLLGTGLDYSIHVLLSLRRTGGDLRAMWNGTGKAVLFCGSSTAIGFGSLSFASNDALASLGHVAVLGILISMTVSVLLLPGIRAGRAPA